MIYAALKAAHLLAIVVWVGGMFFAHACLRPALALLDPPARLRLMSDVLQRFLRIVEIGVGLVLVSGLAMLWLSVRASTAPGLAFNMPLDWKAMIGLGLVMMGIFGYTRGVLLGRLRRAVQAQDWPAGAAVLARIRGWVAVNLVLGVLVIAGMRLGTAN